MVHVVKGPGQNVLRWYIGQCELRSLKYGAKSPQMVHWAM